MPVPLIALFAVALHQARVGYPDAAASTRAISLLARAAGGGEVALDASGPLLLVNGTPVDAAAPGVRLALQMLRERELTHLTIPDGVDTVRWEQLITLFAAAPGLYPTTAHLRQALEAIVPNATLVGDEERRGDGVADGSVHDFGRTASPVPIGSAAADRADLSKRLDPLLAQGEAAIAEADYVALAEVLLALRAMEDSEGAITSAIVATERRNLGNAEHLVAIARLLPRPDTPSVVPRALHALGSEAAEAIVALLERATSRIERRVYIDALAANPESTGAVLHALKSREPQLLADVAEVAGHRALAVAIPALDVLLRHDVESVRTAAWHALEQIGTPTAMDILHRR